MIRQIISLKQKSKMMKTFKKKWDNTKEPYVERGKQFYCANRLCIPQGKETIMNDNHKSLLGGHRGERKTLNLIKRHFYWSSLRKRHQELRTFLC